VVEINYEATPTGKEFHGDEKFARFILGPFGSGKTTIGLMELLLKGLQQEPDTNGIRRTRGVVVRNTYPELRSTTLPSYNAWFKDISKITYGSPITSTVDLPLPDGTRLHQQCFFIPLDDEQSVKKLMSLEITFGFLDEFVFIPERVLEVLSGRVGRYPEVRDGGPTWYGYWGTSNPCPVEHWYYKLSQEVKPEEFSFYQQPPGLIPMGDAPGSVRDAEGNAYRTNPTAENLRYLPEGYYEKQCVGKDEDYVNVYLMGNFGELRSGKPVYPTYRDKVHCATEDIVPDPRLPIMIGVDIGLHGNAAVFCQLTPTGTLYVFDELFTEGQSVTEFVTDTLKPHIFAKYFNFNSQLIVDPAAKARGQTNKKSAYDIFVENDLPIECAETNDFVARKEAVTWFLAKHEGFLLSPDCHMLRRGFISQYKYETVRGTDRLKEKAEKNRWSHNHDALQYACLKIKRFKTRPRRRIDWDNDYKPGCSRAGY
jgi:hypothetical protein